MTAVPSCYTCKHFYPGRRGCAAFAIIPSEIATGRNEHTEPYPGDNGIQYEPVTARQSELNKSGATS